MSEKVNVNVGKSLATIAEFLFECQMEEADSRSQSGYISSRSTYRRGRKLERNVTELMKLLNGKE